MITKVRAIFLSFALQLLSLLLLTQTWFSISMSPNGSTVTLGDFDGATTFTIAMPLNLLALSAILIASISTGLTRITVLAVAALSNLTAVLVILPKIVSQDISALDQQLDRLTGIANTHGIDELSIGSSITAWLWALVSIAAFLWLAASSYLSRRWLQRDKSKRSKSPNDEKKSGSSTSPIDLWDDQRR